MDADKTTLDSSIVAARPSTIKLLSLALCTALLFAWLAVYALTNALIAAELIPPFIHDQDPRLTWLGIAVSFILTLQLTAFATLRHISQRHQKTLDELDQADEDNTPTFASPMQLSAQAKPQRPASPLHAQRADPSPTPPPGPDRHAA